MCRFIESIKVANRHFFNLPYHQARMDLSRLRAYGQVGKIDLKKHLKIPESPGLETYKCRIVYGKDIEVIEFIKYQTRSIKTLKLIEDNEIDYTFKYADRENINQLFEQRGHCDDILIIKNNLITDTSYCNIVFFDGQSWVTPELPLLKGTKRQQLLDESKIGEAKITVEDVGSFQKFMLINAMLDFDENRSLSIHGIEGCD